MPYREFVKHCNVEISALSPGAAFTNLPRNCFMSEQLGVGLGVVLMLVGLGYLFKAFIAIGQGRLWYWTGFLPLTLISPWLIFNPPNERKEKSLSKVKEALWVPLFFGPMFLFCSFCCLVAGADLANLPGSKMTNNFLTSWTSDKTPIVVFDKKHYKMQFPAAIKTANKITKMFFGGGILQIKQEDKLLPPGS